MTADRVNVEDLLGAADWLRAFESTDGPIGDNGAPADDERAQELLRVAAWIDAEVQRRLVEQTARDIARKNGVSTTTARRALKRAIAEGATP